MASWIVLTSYVSPAYAQAHTTVPDRVTCMECVIELTPIATLGKPEYNFLLTPRSEVIVDSEGRFIVAPSYQPGTIGLLSSTGELIRTFGRKGGGPGEFSGASMYRLVVSLGDTVHVFDRLRHSVLEPGLAGFVRANLVRFRPLQRAVALPTGDIVMSSPVATAERFGPVQIVSTDDSVVGVVGADETWREAANLADGQERVRAVAAGSGGNVWISRTDDYALQEWSVSGKHIRTVRRQAPWFEDEPGQPWGTWLRSIWVDDSGLLWVNIRTTSDRDFMKNLFSSPVPTPLPPGVAWAQRVFDTVIEVIDPDSATVLARLHLDDVYASFPGRGFVYSQDEDSEGYIIFHVWKMRLIDTRD